MRDAAIPATPRGGILDKGEGTDGIRMIRTHRTHARLLRPAPPWRPRLVRRGGLLLLGMALAFQPTPLRAQAPAGSSPAGDSIGVRPGDLIRMKVWREPDLSGDIMIDAAGNATLPRLGPVAVAGWAPDSLRRFMVSSYAKYLKDPAIEVTVLPRVTILGAVRTPGVQNLDPTLTLADALALAGGASSDGKQDHIELRRRGARVPVKLNLATRLADTPVRSGDQLVVPERSWLSRNTGVVLGIVSVSTSLLYLVLR
jgi:protein involved in polysaccharide export with SLBB domain